jgi:hypothetical protein
MGLLMSKISREQKQFLKALKQAPTDTEETVMFSLQGVTLKVKPARRRYDGEK